MATPYLPCSGLTEYPYLLVLFGSYSHYSSICGSCSAVRMPLHNIAWTSVATVSPSEFIPVSSKTPGGLCGIALPFKSKFPLLVVNGLGRGLEYYLSCIFS